MESPQSVVGIAVVNSTLALTLRTDWHATHVAAGDTTKFRVRVPALIAKFQLSTEAPIQKMFWGALAILLFVEALTDVTHLLRTAPANW